jgi:hypothetical protein
MYRLGLRLSLRSGREALVRLLVTSAAVAVGVTVVLGVLADYHAFQATSRRPAWENTQPAPANAPASREELWNYSENIFKGRFVEQLDVAALGDEAPLVPGLSELPRAGQFDASPALTALLRRVPADELGARFPGVQVGTIGEKALSGPDELAIVIGYSPAALARLPNTITVDAITAGPELQGTTNIYRLASRLAASRREERYAALRLVGATPRQVDVIATVDAIVGAAIGTLAGIGLFLLVRPILADISFSGVRFFSSSVTPALSGYVIMLAGVPAAAAVASLLSLRRVRVSPLGVSRRTTPSPPTVRRVIPILIGVPLFVVPLLSDPGKPVLGLVFAGLFLIMVGLVAGGSWLTMQAARLLPRVGGGASSLLAARRLSDNPKAAFRAASGLVLAVFVGTLIAVLVPVLNAAQEKGATGRLTNVLRVPYADSGGPASGLAPQTGAKLLRDLHAYPGIAIIPIYVSPEVQVASLGPPPRSTSPTFDSVVTCGGLARLPVLGTCPPGAAAVDANVDDFLFTDNPIFFNKDLPVVSASSPRTSGNVSGLSLAALLIKTTDAATLERVRTFLTTFDATIAGGGDEVTAWQMGQLEPETFGEVAKIRSDDDTNVERVVLAGVVLTLLVAGCSLAVTVGGSLVERKRPFTLLRLSGTPLSTLYRVVLLESALPLVLASIVSAATAVAVGEPAISAVLTQFLHHPVSAYPTPGYYVTVGAGLAVSLAVIVAAMPLLGRITSPDGVRFE